MCISAMSIRTRAIYFSDHDGWVDNFMVGDESDGDESDGEFDIGTDKVDGRHLLDDDSYDDIEHEMSDDGNGLPRTGADRYSEIFIIYAKHGTKYLAISCYVSYNFSVSRSGNTYHADHTTGCIIGVDDVSEARMNMQHQTHVGLYGDTYRSQPPELAHKLLDFVYAAYELGYTQLGHTSFEGDVIDNVICDGHELDFIILNISPAASRVLDRHRYSDFDIEEIPGRESVASYQTLLFNNY